MVNNLIKSKQEYNRILNDMRGVDASGRGGSKTKRYAYIENMYRDYGAERGELIESVPGFRRVYQGSSINGLHLQNTASGERYVIINDDGVLKRYKEGDPSGIEKLGDDCNVAKCESYSFPFGGKLFIGDGANLFGVRDDGVSRMVYEVGENQPYFPTVYLNGEEYEQRNLLVSCCYEKHKILSAGRHMRDTASLIYRVTSETSRLCSVCGITDASSEVFVPATTRINGREYTVTAIDGGAFFNNAEITSVTLADTVEKIGVGAFNGCVSLRSFIGGAGLTEICDTAFINTRLESIYLPAGFKVFGESCLPSATVINYELGASDYENLSEAPSNRVIYGSSISTMPVGIRLHTKTKNIITVKIDGIAVSSYIKERSSDDYIRQIIINGVNKKAWTGKTLEICLYADESAYHESNYGVDFTKLVAKRRLIFSEVIRNCRRARVIGDRIFVWGNPSLPSCLFYSSARDSDGRLYFGSLDYIDVGGVGEVLSVLPIEEGVAVFARRVDGGESILFCERRKRECATDEDCFVVSGRYRTSELSGAVASLNGESVFLTGSGLYAIGDKTIYESHKIEPRSSLIAPLLAREDLSSARLTEWCGYTVISTNGNLYLADPRRSAKIEGHYEPEWFCLSGIGTYRNDRRVYRYASVERNGYVLSDTPGERVKETVWSEGIGDGNLIYYIKSNDQRIEVYPTEEMSGGRFFAAKLLLGFDDRLIFSTSCGDVCCFNTDMRGVAPDVISEEPGFAYEEYERVMGNKIHPYFYDFNLHAPRYALITAADDCGIPHLRKSTVRRSLVLKLASFIGARVHCEVSCDGGGFKEVGAASCGVIDMSALPFGPFLFDDSEAVSTVIPESERGWVEKSIALCSDDFRSPIGVYSVCYRYKINGRIKNS